ncbi:MAG: protein TolR [Gammaproteobacteria bacterium]|nr:protein TolR [Gammaproteobacteria bacterium]
MNRRHRRRPMSQINVVPYIDVMLVLLVIFMITAPLLSQGVKVELPKAASKAIEREADEPLIVTVDRKGHYFLNIGDKTDKPIDHDVLVQKVAAVMRYKPQIQVLVRGDRDVNYGAVVTAMALLQKAGAPSVGLLTETPGRKP